MFALTSRIDLARFLVSLQASVEEIHFGASNEDCRRKYKFLYITLAGLIPFQTNNTRETISFRRAHSSISRESYIMQYR